MGKKEEIEGQLSFDFCMDARNYVCQANALVGGKQALKLNSAKLIRSAIMQVVREDEDLKPYIITIKELSELFQVPSSNIYRDIDEITNDIINNPVYIKENRGNSIRWIKIPWVTKCEYNSEVGVLLKLNDELKPFLLNLRNNYTQYPLESILIMRSVYSIRLYELLESKITHRILPKEGVDIPLSVTEIRECCGCESKAYDSFGNLRTRVIDVAIREIEEKTLYRVSYEYIKKGRAVVGVLFHIKTVLH